MLAGNWPPDETTLRPCSRSPWTLNVVTVSLPALTAIRTEWPESYTSEPCEARRSDSVPGAAAPPFPPVAYVPACESVPSEARS